MAIISIWYCTLFALKYRNQADSSWEATGLVLLTSFLIFVYFLWMVVIDSTSSSSSSSLFSFSCYINFVFVFKFSIRYHYRVFREWQEKNPIITLNIKNDINMSIISQNTATTPSTTTKSKGIKTKRQMNSYLQTTNDEITLTMGSSVSSLGNDNNSGSVHIRMPNDNPEQNNQQQNLNGAEVSNQHRHYINQNIDV
jgi:hypothetical protein